MSNNRSKVTRILITDVHCASYPFTWVSWFEPVWQPNTIALFYLLRRKISAIPADTRTVSHADGRNTADVNPPNISGMFWSWCITKLSMLLPELKYTSPSFIRRIRLFRSNLGENLSVQLGPKKQLDSPCLRLWQFHHLHKPRWAPPIGCGEK